YSGAPGALTDNVVARKGQATRRLRAEGSHAVPRVDLQAPRLSCKFQGQGQRTGSRRRDWQGRVCNPDDTRKARYSLPRIRHRREGATRTIPSREGETAGRAGRSSLGRTSTREAGKVRRKTDAAK